MLKKVIRYDFKAILKYWWIAALSSFVLACVGGGCTEILNSEKELTEAVYVLSMLGIVLVIISFVAFFILSEILVFLRFYKNFFTDEGYLTFTLPVKRSQLLSSKLITSCIVLIATGIILMIDIGIIAVIDLRKDIFRQVGKFGMKEIKSFSTSSLITRTTNDITQIQNTGNQKT